jgi:hypothetical protein
LLKSFQLTNEKQFGLALKQIQQADQPTSNLGTDDFSALVSSRILFFKALTHLAAGDVQSSKNAWLQASRTVDQDLDGEGLFRAVGLYYSGERDEAEAWFERFEEINQLRKTDNSTSVKVLAHYLGGIYSIFRGNLVEGRQDLQIAIGIDESDLFVRHALLWFENDLFNF